MRSPHPFPINRLTSPRHAQALPFIAQPLYSARDREIFGYESLYAGATRPTSWTEVDVSMLSFLSSFQIDVPLFVNLSNETICSIDEEMVFEAHRINNIFFEWSEVMIDDAAYTQIIAKLNAWGKKGLRIVIDDLGAGRDGLHRILAVEYVTAVKFDGDFFRKSETNRFAKSMIESMVKLCDVHKILTVAECVETHQHYLAAQSLGVDFIQGFYIDKICHDHLQQQYAA
jgi:EAL domain-containing protein (putative c-di-GMP-specific phosphodiesterase class I)